MVISSGLGSGQLSRPVKKARKARKANPGLLDTWLIGPLLGLRFRLWTLAHTLGWTTNQPGLAGTVESCLVLLALCQQWPLPSSGSTSLTTCLAEAYSNRNVK